MFIFSVFFLHNLLVFNLSFFLLVCVSCVLSLLVFNVLHSFTVWGLGLSLNIFSVNGFNPTLLIQEISVIIILICDKQYILISFSI